MSSAAHDVERKRGVREVPAPPAHDLPIPTIPSPELSACGLLSLQRSAGNSAVVSMLRARGLSAAPARGVFRNGPDAGAADAGVVDAGESLPGGVAEPKEEPPIPIDLLTDDMLGAVVAQEGDAGVTPARAAEAEAEIEKRTEWLESEYRLGAGIGVAASPSSPGATVVTPEVALAILDNVSKGEPPFKPQLGKGGCSWFVTEGTPYTGVDTTKNVPVQVDVAETPGKLVFKEAELAKLMAEEAVKTAPDAEATFRERFGIAKDKPLSSKLRKSLVRFAKQFAESRMWTRVGETIASSSVKVGEVVLEPGSAFSKSPGKFAVVAEASKIKLRGGIAPLADALVKGGYQVQAPLIEAAEKLASKQKWAGRVRAVFRVGGKVLILVAITADVIKIYHAEDKTKAVITSAGGWVGASAAGAAFAAWWIPADVAGPWAWAAHGVGTLVSGAIGYWVGSEVTRTVYELAAL